jgi:hypothetical protein
MNARIREKLFSEIVSAQNKINFLCSKIAAQPPAHYQQEK